MREALTSMRASAMLFAMATAFSGGDHAALRRTVTSFVIHRLPAAGGTADRTFFAGATGQVMNDEGLVLLTVKGPLLDLSTGADIVDASGVVVSGSRASIDHRQSGDNSQIDVTLDGLNGKPPGDYRVRIHYAVEANGPDVVKLRVLAHGTVTSITRDPEPAVFGGAYTPLGPTYTFRASGSGLNVATVEASAVAGMNFVVVSRSSTLFVFTIRPTQPGQVLLRASAFYDENLGHAPTATDDAQLRVRYTGGGLIDILAAGLPVVTSVTPQPASASGVISLAGANLSGSGLILNRILYAHRYSAATQSLTRSSSAGTGTFSSFTTSASMLAAYDIAGQPLQLEFVPETIGGPLQGGPTYTLSVPFTASYPPAIGDVIASAEQATISGVRVLRAGTATVTGKYLFALGAAPSKGDATGLSSFFPSASSSPVVTLGSLSLPVISTKYVAPSGGIDGRDSVRVTLPDPADNVSGQLHLDTGVGGSAITAGAFALVTRPHVTQLGELGEGVALPSLVNTQTLTRGKRYQVAGTSLSVMNGTQLLQAGTVRINSRTMTMESTADPGAQLRFIVPLDATSGVLVVSTLGGETTIGTLAVVDAATGAIPTPRPTSVTITPFTVPAGVSASGTVTFDNPGASVAGFAVALSSSDTSAATVPAALAVSGTSGSFPIATKTVTVPRTVTITATSGGATRSQTFTVAPPGLAALTLSATDVLAGATVTATLTFSAPMTGASVTLTSSDVAVPVPLSVAVSGTTGTFPIATTEAPAPRTVTITASANGATKSASVTITPLRIVSTANTRDTISAGQKGSLSVTLNRAPATTETFSVFSSQPMLLQAGKPSFQVAAGQTTGNVELRVVGTAIGPTSVTITISRSVSTAAFGTVTTSATRNVVVVP